MHESLLNPKKPWSFLKLLKIAENRKMGKKNKTIIELNRALQFLSTTTIPIPVKQVNL